MMELPSDFWEPRRCFLPPIPELRYAIDFISDAADALSAGDLSLARELIRRADIPSVWDFAATVMGSTKPSIHRYRRIDAAAPDMSVKVKERIPGARLRRTIHARDGWRCRFCECRVVSAEARKKLISLAPGAICWSGPDKGKHAAFYALSASLDHVVPHARGGDNDPSNLVTTCQCCNFGRNNWLLEEVGLIDPRLHAPVVDEWDGLTRLLRL